MVWVDRKSPYHGLYSKVILMTNKKKVLDTEVALLLGASTGIIATSSAIIINVELFGTCKYYSGCTLSYFFVGILFLIFSLLYKKYKLVIKKRGEEHEK